MLNLLLLCNTFFADVIRGRRSNHEDTSATSHVLFPNDALFKCGYELSPRHIAGAHLVVIGRWSTPDNCPGRVLADHPYGHQPCPDRSHRRGSTTIRDWAWPVSIVCVAVAAAGRLVRLVRLAGEGMVGAVPPCLPRDRGRALHRVDGQPVLPADRPMPVSDVTHVPLRSLMDTHQDHPLPDGAKPCDCTSGSRDQASANEFQLSAPPSLLRLARGTLNR